MTNPRAVISSLKEKNEDIIIIDNIILDLYKLEDRLVYGDTATANDNSKNTIHPLELADILHSISWRLNKYNTERKLNERQ